MSQTDNTTSQEEIRPNALCGRYECLVSDIWMCVGCLGDESNDYMFDGDE